MEKLIQKHGLSPYRDEILRSGRRCVIGKTEDASISVGCSKLGGVPDVPGDFEWPLKDGYPLDFVAQIRCSDLEFVGQSAGLLYFFYDNRHWGYSPEDRGHAVVMFHATSDNLQSPTLPETEVKSFFGLRRRKVRPKVYQELRLRFETTTSFPSLELESVALGDEAAEEAYSEFLADVHHDIQLLGHVAPIQGDDMEEDCIKTFGLGTRDDWILLLQLYEVGDMMWGDAGALYWFIHRDDLKSGRFDRVWMVTQCH